MVDGPDASEWYAQSGAQPQGTQADDGEVDGRRRGWWPMLLIAAVVAALVSLLAGWVVEGQFSHDLITNPDRSEITLFRTLAAGVVVLIIGLVAFLKTRRSIALVFVGVAVWVVVGANVIGMFSYLSNTNFSAFYAADAFTSDYEVVSGADEYSADLCRMPDGVSFGSGAGLPTPLVNPLKGVNIDDLGSPVTLDNRGDRYAISVTIDAYERMDDGIAGTPLGQLKDVDDDGRDECAFYLEGTIKGSLIRGGRPLFIETNCGVVQLAVEQDIAMFEEDCPMEIRIAEESVRMYGDMYGA